MICHLVIPASSWQVLWLLTLNRNLQSGWNIPSRLQQYLHTQCAPTCLFLKTLEHRLGPPSTQKGAARQVLVPNIQVMSYNQGQTHLMIHNKKNIKIEKWENH
jgi:hypothetical protein